jgi:uncharacterized protein
MVKRTGERRTQAGRFDAFRLAARGEAIVGEVDIAGRERVADRIAPRQGAVPIEWRIEGGCDTLARPRLTITVHGGVGLTCQRCLQRFDLELDQRSEVLVARDEAELRRLDAEEHEVLLASAPLDALTLVEDEVLLSLPFAPMHPPGECPDEAQAARAAGTTQGTKQQVKQDTPSPFARLAAIKRRPGRT